MLPLPGWPTFNVASPHPFFVRMAQLYNNLVLVFPVVAAVVGILANGDMESAETPSAAGDHDESFNVWQWKWNPRGIAIAGATAIDLRTERSLAKIVYALNWEITNKFPALRDKLIACTTGAEAAGIFCSDFEMAGAADAMTRRMMDAPRIEVFLSDNAAWVAAQGLGS